MNAPQEKTHRIAQRGLLAIGTLLLGIALFADPIGPSPDSGVLDLGSTGTRYLLGVLGGVFLAGDIAGFFRR